MKSLGFALLLLGLCACALAPMSDMYVIAYSAMILPILGLVLIIAAAIRDFLQKLSHIFMDTINSALFICYVSSLIDGWEYESFFS